MVNASSEFKQMLIDDKRKFLAYVDITLADGTVLHLNNSHIWEGGFKTEDAVSGSGYFQIGAAIINKLNLSLNNIYDDFFGYNFTGAEVVAYVGLELPDGTIEKLRKGTYTVTDEAGQNSSAVSLECLDNMRKFERSYSESTLQYPATLEQILQDACSACGVYLQTTTFANGSYVVQERPADESITFREIVSYVAQIAGKWARCDAYGRLVLGWYDDSDILTIKILADDDGGVIDTGDGAVLALLFPAEKEDFLSGDIVTSMHRITSISTQDISLSDVTITGVQVKEIVDDKEVTRLYGEKGYVISIEDNKLIASGQAVTVAELVGKQIIGMTFRPMSIAALSDPTIEAGDRAYVIDPKNNVYTTYFNNASFSMGDYQNLSCEAETPERNSIQRDSPASRIIAEARRNTAKQISDYDVAVQMLTGIIANSLGMFETKEETENGGVITYQHNKPTLAESSTIWKKTEDVFTVSTDGGKTWNAGMDANGNAVVNVLSAIGINFDWAKGGTLTLGGASNGNGKLVILSSTGKQVGYIDNTGVHFNEGVFSGELNAATGKLGQVYTFGNGKSVWIYNGEIEFMEGDTYTSGSSAGQMKAIQTAYGPTQSAMGVALNGESAACLTVNDVIFLACADYASFVMESNVIFLAQNTYATKNFECSGTKSRRVNGTHYGDVLLYSYETPTPQFGDVGFGCLDENGECFISIDDVLSETVNLNIEYAVFLQKEGQGDLWVDSKEPAFFMVKGTPGLSFSWELKATQRGFENLRLDDRALTDIETEESSDLMAIFDAELQAYDLEMEGIFDESIESISSD